MTFKRKFAAAIAGLSTLAFLFGMALPLAVDRWLVTAEPFKSLWASFLLVDQDGRRHVGFMAFGNVIYNADFFEYGYEAPPGTDLSAWVRKIIGVPRESVERPKGFVWADSGFLWGDSQHFGPDVEMVEGSRLALGRAIGEREQIELTLPGAPWDIRTPTQSFFGRFPSYQYRFEDENFDLDLTLTASVPHWVMYHEGEPFAVGDFGHGSMNETAGRITGTIVHKKTGERFNVQGDGLLEDAVGVPWSWIEWGGHDWNDFHFEGGWHGSLWVARDDWQWGRHPDPRLGWIWDPALGKVHHFKRVEIVQADLATDPLSGIRYPKRAVWRAVANDATLEIENRVRTFKPRETLLPKLGSLKMGYGNNAVTGRLVRRDGTVAELRDGTGTMEHFEPVIPDYAVAGPLILLLNVLGWTGLWAVVRREQGRTLRAPVAAALAGIGAIAALMVAWS